MVTKDTKLLRLVSARLDMSYSLEAYGILKSLDGPENPLWYHAAVSMAVCYGRPFTEANGLGKIQVDYPNFPDFTDAEMNVRHHRLIDLRNKFMAHSSCEGTEVLILPPGTKNPMTGEVVDRHDHLVGKRVFGDLRFFDWLKDVAVALKGRLDVDVRSRLVHIAGAANEVFEMETGFDDFQWSAPQKPAKGKSCLNTGTVVESKTERYSALVRSRKACNRCAAIGLRNPVSILDGAFDSDEIGPWTCWNGDLDARILIVGQEWGDVDSFERQKGRDDPSGTNRMLRELLAFAGFDIAPAPIKVPASGVYLTNAALCLKSGGVQAPVKDEWFKNCGVSFLRAQVEIVDPRVVVALGQQAYRALCYAFGIPQGSFRDVVNRHKPIPLPTGASLVAVYHCGQRILNTHRRRDEQFEDWKLVKSIAEDGNRDAGRGISSDRRGSASHQ